MRSTAKTSRWRSSCCRASDRDGDAWRGGPWETVAGRRVSAWARSGSQPMSSDVSSSLQPSIVSSSGSGLARPAWSSTVRPGSARPRSGEPRSTERGRAGAIVLRSAPAESERPADPRRADRPPVGGRRRSSWRRSPRSSATPWRSRSCGPSRPASCRTSGRCRWRPRRCCGSSPARRRSSSRIDDAQWLDDASASILAYAVRRLADRPRASSLAVRGEPTPATLELTAGVPGRRERLRTLGPMPLAALHQLFLARFGRSFPRLVLVRIEEASGGNPFYALEIARAARRRIDGRDARRAIAADPETLGALVEARIAALAGGDSVGAAAGRRGGRADDRHAPSCGPDTHRSPRPGVRRRASSRMDRRSIRFTHPLLAQAVIGVGEPGRAPRRPRGRSPGRRRPTMRGRATSAARPRAAMSTSPRRSRRPLPAARARGATLDAASLYERASELTPRELGDERPPPGDARRRSACSSTSRRSSRRTRILDAAIAAARARVRRAPRRSASGRSDPLLPRPDPGRGPARRAGARRGRRRPDSGAPGPRPGCVPRHAARSRARQCPRRRRPSGSSRPSMGRRPSTRTSGRTSSCCTRAPSSGSSAATSPTRSTAGPR